jgi:predicted neuraminidase
VQVSPGVIRSEFLYESAPFPSCHASTIAQTPRGLVAAFFGGTKERDPDVCIYVCRHVDRQWQPPVAVADGVQADGSRQPTWNPVLFQPTSGPLMLFYKVGSSPSSWWGMLKTSEDCGETWSDATRLPDGILGPIKNKPVELSNGDILSPTSIESRELGWRIYFERSCDGGKSWSASPLVEQDENIKAIQPSILVHSPTRLQAIGRTRSAKLFETWSDDGGQTWSKLRLTDMPNCNSGTDAVTLRDGRHVLVYNHSSVEKVRVPLNVALSRDGVHWEAAAVLEDQGAEQYSYPAVVQAANGLLHVTYTWKRLRIKHAVINPQAVQLRSITKGNWPQS